MEVVRLVTSAQKMYEKELEVNAANKNKRGRATREQTQEEKEVLSKIEETRKELLKIKKEREYIIEKKKEEIANVTKNNKTVGTGRSKAKAQSTDSQKEEIEKINKRYAVLEDRLDQRIGALQSWRQHF